MNFGRQPPELTLSELQSQLPWSINYADAFKLATYSGLPYLEFQHALIHVVKATGKLATMVEDADHGRDDVEPFPLPEMAKLLSDLVICALRMANVQPRLGYRIDLGREIVRRLESKNGVRLVKGDLLTEYQRGVVEDARRFLDGAATGGALTVATRLLGLLDALAPAPSPRPPPVAP